MMELHGQKQEGEVLKIKLQQECI